MRICMICLCLGDIDRRPLIGGHENTVVRFAKELSKRGNEIVIITTPSRYTTSSNFNSRVIELNWGKIISLPVLGKYASLKYGFSFVAGLLYKLKELHFKDKFEIIHGHSGYPILNLVTGIAGKVLKIPTVHSIYCPIEQNKYLSRFYLSGVDVIISLSRNISNSLKRIGISENKIKILPPIIDLELFNPSVSGENIKKNFNIESSPSLLYVGDLTKTRGLHVLIDALGMVVSELPDVKLLMAVNMPSEEYNYRGAKIKEKIRSLKLEDNVVFLGIVDNMPKVIAAVDVFVAPYTSIDGIADYPISILEAMACGKPVVATAVGGIPEIVNHKENGLIVRPNDPVELAEAIVYLFNSENRLRDMGLKSAKFIFKRFRTENIVHNLERIYQETLSNAFGYM